MQFKDSPLHADLKRALAKHNIDTPTEVQQQSLQSGLEGKDLYVSSETGSGKTLAFLLPLFHRLLTQPDNKQSTRALILVPTRELAQQIHSECLRVGSYTQLGFKIITGGEDYKKQIQVLRRNPEIVIGTPGRVLAHIEEDQIDLSQTECLVLDEADRMLDMGFADEVMAIVQKVNPERQSYLFSATLGHAGIRNVADFVLREPVKLTLNSRLQANPNITHRFVLADDEHHKLDLVFALITQDDTTQSMVFTRTKIAAEAMTTELRKRDIRVGVLHGDMDQAHRKQIFTRFRAGDFRALITTDVAARGLDVEGVSKVINVHMPRTGKDYTHRVGRTGRAGQQGIAYSLIDHTDWSLMISIRRYLKLDWQPEVIEGLEAEYKGPKNVKSNGKPVGKKKKKPKYNAKLVKADALPKRRKK
ncbi:MAG: DEAD/DEAH box helicase [Gammaproteobacteria bacterium]|nr:DEAD/DEAH box helicase [Gammaproteobacteria bacterium]